MLAWWKRQYLSNGGRYALIKSILSCLSIYLMSVFVIPKSSNWIGKVTEKLTLDGGELWSVSHV